MDEWQREPQGHKRSFTEMSHSATLSPSPISFMGGASFFSAPRFTPAPSNENFERQRRRTSHPHNVYLQRASEEMADRSQSQHRPRLEHRASQTIIDLTDDPEEIPVPLRNAPPQSRSSRPPHLGRSDAVNLGDLIDLTDDSADQDVIITGAIQRQLPLPRPPRPAPAAGFRAESPSLFLPAHHRPAINRVFPAEPHGLDRIVIGAARIERAGGGFGAGMGLRVMHQDLMDQIHFMQHGQVQAMPNGLNYQNAAFADRKPEHVAPPPARSGFTRSPTEDDVLVCPSCEEELIQNNDIEEPALKKSGKAPTKKEREEHPFWVVKECGHVYCNTCFQHRAKQGFNEQTKQSGSKKSKGLACAVEDCECDVKGKDKWVGVFL